MNNMTAYKIEGPARTLAAKLNGKVVPAVGGGFFVVTADMNAKRTERYAVHGAGSCKKAFGNTTNNGWVILVGSYAPNIH